MNNASLTRGKRMRRAMAVLAATGLTLGIAAESPAEVTGFYEGKTLEVLIPWAPGGGADQWGRYIAATLGPYLGDGVFGYMYGSRGVRYDFREYEPIVAMAQGGAVYARADLGVETPQDLWEVEELIYGEVSPQAIGSMALTAFALLDLPHEVVFGYESRGPARLALEQGETNIDFQTTTPYSASVEPLIEEGLVVPLFSLGILDADGEVVRDPAFPDLPTVVEVYEERYGEAPSGVAWDAYRAVLSAGTIKMLWAKPDAPQASIEDLRGAFRLALQDEAFMADSVVANGPYDWLIGQEAYRAMSASLDVSEEALDFLRATFKERYGADL